MAEATTRKECIKNDERCPGLFYVSDNPGANGNAPWYEAGVFSSVEQYYRFIETAAAEKNVDAQLIRAIMFIEETHGYYDAPLNLIGWNKSIRPMNINVDYWGDTFGTRQQMQDPLTNIRAGAEMIRRIESNMPTHASIEKIATLYNNINATTVNDYGMRVKKIYEEKPWFEAKNPKPKESFAR
jgi:hypothetical protein